MPSRDPLSDNQIEAALADLDGWTRDGDRVVKTYTFGDFREAVSFVVRVAFHCEAHNHHPELTNVYNRVTLAFNTHDAGDKITEMDLALARAIERFAWTSE
ncbi:MAG: 4a-hydroxytetrahydrobiopterin dehydratase [Rhodothermaceae bacterium]|nr:4a-hydroxytetrahydrobiopterin dehydratase [Rhodothermaceae bacterium]